MKDEPKPRRSADSGRPQARRAARGAARPAESTPNTLGDWRRRARSEMTAAGLASPATDADYLAAHALGLTRADLIQASPRRLTPAEGRRLAKLLHKRLQHFPLQYLLGDVDFAGVRILVRAGVFIPRPETEGLVERILGELPGAAGGLVLDLGTGTGAIALALAAAREDLVVWGSDVSTRAVRLARRNARALTLGDRCRFFVGDLAEPVVRAARPAPLVAVVSNPPYVAFREKPSLPRDVREHEPSSALFAPDGGLATIKRIVHGAADLLESGGLLALEIGETQGQRVRVLLADAGVWRHARIEQDLAGKDRYALARRV